VPRQLGALFEVLGGGFAAFPLANALRAIVDVDGLDVLVEGLGVVEDGEAEEAGAVLPFAHTSRRVAVGQGLS
jgi:hypothetical protein